MFGRLCLYFWGVDYECKGGEEVGIGGFGFYLIVYFFLNKCVIFM